MSEEFIHVDLPSRGLAYPGVDMSKVAIRTLTGKEEKLLAEMTSDNLEKKFLAVLKNVLQGMDPIKLTVGDRLYLIVWEAINSYTQKIDFDHICGICYQKIQTSADLSKLNIKELPKTYKEPYEVSLSNDKLIHLRLATVQDEINIADFEKRGESSYLYRFALTIVDNTDVVERMKFLEGLSGRDFVKIRAFQNKFYHGPDMTIKNHECELCGGVEDIPVPFRIGLLFQSGEGFEERFDTTI